MSIRRLAGAIRTLLKRPRRTLQRVPLDELKQHALNTLVDCHDAGSDLLRGSIGRKADAVHLWGLRPALHQYLSRQHDSREAARRLDRLAVHFRGWLPAFYLAPLGKQAPGRSEAR
jgi:hypothetical protein